MHSSVSDNATFLFDPENYRNSDILIHEFLKTNVKGKIIYNLDKFLIRASYGYASDQGYFSMRYHVNILGYNNPHVHELDPSSKVFNSKNHQFMNLIYTLGKNWLKSYVQLPHASTYVYGTENAKFDDDVFMNLSADMKKCQLPDSGGSYLSRFTKVTSHIILTTALEQIINHKSIYLTVILLDFMAYASHKISLLIHMHNETPITARKIFKSKIIRAAEHKYKYKFRYINMFLAIIDDVFIMPKIEHHDDTTFRSIIEKELIEELRIMKRKEYNII